MRVARRGDHVEIQRLDFAHAGAAVDRRRGARDADGDVAQRIVDRCGPAQCRSGCGPTRRNMLFFVHGGSSVSRVALRQRSRSRSPSARAAGPSTAIIRSWNGGYGAPAITRCCVLRRVLAGVPAARRQIDAAAEGDRVVDDHDLLMMRAAGRMRVVVAESRSGGAASTTGRTAAPTRGRARRSSGSPRSGCGPAARGGGAPGR